MLWAREGRWGEINEDWRQHKCASTSTRFTNETRYYFEAGADDLWITFVGERLYWGFLEPRLPMPIQSEHSSIRYVRGGWR
jgi:hypothetical protein